MFKAAAKPLSAEGVGKYAIKFNWNDNHDLGIYSWKFSAGVVPLRRMHSRAKPELTINHSTMSTPESAKKFLLAKLLEQATLDGVSISDIEKRMFLFSETSQDPPDFEASGRFDKEYDDDAYETKIAQLLKRAYARDAKLHGW